MTEGLFVRSFSIDARRVTRAALPKGFIRHGLLTLVRNDILDERRVSEPMVSSGVPIRAPVGTMRARPAAARVREQASGRTHQY